ERLTGRNVRLYCGHAFEGAACPRKGKIPPQSRWSTHEPLSARGADIGRHIEGGRHDPIAASSSVTGTSQKSSQGTAACRARRCPRSGGSIFFAYQIARWERQ